MIHPGLVKRSVTIGGHRTSISLERAFLDELDSIALHEARSFAALVAGVDAARPAVVNLASALRLHVLENLKARANASSQNRP